MSLTHLPADAKSVEVHEVLKRDGCVVIDHVLDRATIATVQSEMAPYVEAQAKCTDEFDGFETKRTGMLVQLGDECGRPSDGQRPGFAGGAAPQPHPRLGLARRAHLTQLLAGTPVHLPRIARDMGELGAQGPCAGLRGRAPGMLFDDRQRRQRMPVAAGPVHRAALAAAKAGGPEVDLRELRNSVSRGIGHAGGSKVRGGSVGGLGE